jgi:hypothetical protein
MRKWISSPTRNFTFFSAKEKACLKSQGIEEKVQADLSFIRNLPTPLQIRRPCRINDGIHGLSLSAVKKFASLYQQISVRFKVIKFVPASGEGSRMFSALLSAREQFPSLHKNLLKISAKKRDEDCHKSLFFFRNLKRFAFFDVLKKALGRQGFQVDALLQSGQYASILEGLLFSQGLNYSKIPKGRILFHRYGNETRTAFEEHWIEAHETMQSPTRKTCVHYTVSSEHLSETRTWAKKILSRYKQKMEITFSAQSKTTHTIAVDLENKPFRDASGNLLLRAGGHGALLPNLNRLASRFEVIFVKNVDNVTRHKKKICLYKKALGGFLLDLRGKIFEQIILLKKKGSEKELKDGFKFLKERLSVLCPKSIQAASPSEQKKYLLERLNRPLRVCGMVKNTGESGGGPFWVEEKDGTLALQIVEASQAVTQKQKNIFQKSTHFNPVDIVCWVRDCDGKPFDLQKFVDKDAAFITHKNYLGNPIKVLEMPGLWNGSMAFWNTVFVDVPRDTFSPVKTVLDLVSLG